MAEWTAAEASPPPDSRETAAYSLFQPERGDLGHWRWLFEHLGAESLQDFLDPLEGILEIAREHGCKTVVVEERYMDADFRSEYSLFWSRLYEDRRPMARRVHFFAKRLTAEEIHQLPADADYIGYSVLRPAPLGPVGRTILRPPSTISADAVLCKVVDRPSLFGSELEVEGVPFCQQDGELLRCAHAAAWIVHFVAQERSLIGRRTTAEIVGLSGEHSKHRPLPSNGLTGEQLQAIFSALGLPAFFYDAKDLPDPPADLPEAEFETGGILGRKARKEAGAQQWEDEMDRERLLRVACKYVNSGFPVVVLTEGQENHAFTIVGWERVGDDVHLFACDDQIGPYERIEDVVKDARAGGEWVAMMVPLPEKVLLTGEAAEQRAWNIAEGSGELEEATTEQERDFADLRDQLRDLRSGLSLRSKLMRGRDFKAQIAADRGPEALRLYRLAHLPNWVWVVEFHDRDARAQHEPCVVAEIILDSTSHDVAPRTLLSTTRQLSRDHGAVRRREGEPSDAPGPGAVWSSTILPRHESDESADRKAA